MIFSKFNELIYTNPAKRDKFILANLVGALLAVIFLTVALAVKFWTISEYIVLHYNIYFGISALGPRYQIFIIPLLGLAVILANFLFVFHFYLTNKLFSYFLAAAAGVFNLILLVAGILLIIAN